MDIKQKLTFTQALELYKRIQDMLLLSSQSKIVVLKERKYIKDCLNKLNDILKLPIKKKRNG